MIRAISAASASRISARRDAAARTAPRRCSPSPAAPCPRPCRPGSAAPPGFPASRRPARAAAPLRWPSRRPRRPERPGRRLGAGHRQERRRRASAAGAVATASSTRSSSPSPILSEDLNIRSRSFLKKDIARPRPTIGVPAHHLVVSDRKRKDPARGSAACRWPRSCPVKSPAMTMRPPPSRPPAAVRLRRRQPLPPPRCWRWGPWPGRAGCSRRWSYLTVFAALLDRLLPRLTGAPEEAEFPAADALLVALAIAHLAAAAARRLG